jgi:plasmid maintenance system antidote protein VapI
VRRLRIPANRIPSIIQTKRGTTPDTTMWLARYFGTSVDFFVG